jgi:hypothetical protein
MNPLPGTAPQPFRAGDGHRRPAQSPGRPTEIQYSDGRRNFRSVLHHCPIESELDGPASLLGKGRVREQLPPPHLEQIEQAGFRFPRRSRQRRLRSVF